MWFSLSGRTEWQRDQRTLRTATMAVQATTQGWDTVGETATVQGTKICVRRKDLEAEDDCQDPNFFDEDYSIAASTGMVVWEGSWALIALLRDPSHWICARLRGARVVELGAGTGLLGLCAAAAGGSVLLTDVPAVVSEMLLPNLASNASSGAEAEGGGWPGARPVGAGSAAAAPLDWWRPVEEQLLEGAQLDPRDADVVLAAECVWLKELVEPFVATVLSLMRGPRRPTCLMGFRERAVEGSQTFAASSSVMDEFRARGCFVLEHGEVGEQGQCTTLYELRLSPPAAPATGEAASGGGAAPQAQ